MAFSALKEEDLKLMLAAKVHIGTKNIDPQQHRYIWRRRQDGERMAGGIDKCAAHW